MSHSYLITIIIPAYNIQDYIRVCIESILPQLSEDVELIIINDGSTDRTGDICDSFAESRNNIQVIHQDNLGVSTARNNGLDQANGKYIFYVDGDDILSLDAIQKIKEKIISTDADIISGRFVKFYKQIETKETKNIARDVIDSIESKTGEYALAEIMNRSMFLPSMCTSICKRDLLLDNNIRFESHLVNNEDVDCAMQLYVLAKKIAILEAPHYYYRQSREGSASKSYSRKRIESSLYFIDVWRSRISSMPDSSPIKSLLMDYISYQYSITLGAIYLCPEKDRDELLERAKNMVELLGFSLKLNTRIVFSLYRFMGLATTGRLLAFFIKFKALMGKYA